MQCIQLCTYTFSFSCLRRWWWGGVNEGVKCFSLSHDYARGLEQMEREKRVWEGNQVTQVHLERRPLKQCLCCAVCGCTGGMFYCICYWPDVGLSWFWLCQFYMHLVVRLCSDLVLSQTRSFSFASDFFALLLGQFLYIAASSFKLVYNDCFVNMLQCKVVAFC